MGLSVSFFVPFRKSFDCELDGLALENDIVFHNNWINSALVENVFFPHGAIFQSPPEFLHRHRLPLSLARTNCSSPSIAPSVSLVTASSVYQVLCGVTKTRG